MNNHIKFTHHKLVHKMFIYFFLVSGSILSLAVVTLSFYFRSYRILLFIPLIVIFFIGWRWMFKDYIDNCHDVKIEGGFIYVDGVKLEGGDIEVVRPIPHKRYIEILIYPNDKTNIRKIVIPDKLELKELISFTSKSIFLKNISTDFEK